MKKISLVPALCVLCGVALFLILPGAAVLRGADAGVSYPPEPQEPSRDNMPIEQWRAEYRKWSAAHDAWEAGLTVQQYQAWQKELGEQKKARQIEEHKALEKEAGGPVVEVDMSWVATHLPAAGSGYDWRDVASKRKLDVALVDSLAKWKAGYGASVKQSFDPYFGGPVFVTTDSLLNGFHVLLEDTFHALELREAGLLAKNIETLLQAVPVSASKAGFPVERYRAAWRHLQLVLGPAFILTGGSPDALDPGVRDDVAAQVEKIRRAGVVELPLWLAPADATLVALDYRRCKPVGFYAGSEKLAAYFAAVRWLQMVPLRGSRLVEMDAVVLLALAGDKLGDDRFSSGGGLQRIGLFAGPPDDPSPFELLQIISSAYPRDFADYDFTAPAVRVGTIKKLMGAGYYQINSDLRLKTTLSDSFNNVVFRVIPATRLQDAVLFQRLMNAQTAPSGLAVAAMLGAAFASEKLSAGERKIIADAFAEKAPKYNTYDAMRRREGLQIYESYLRMLESLFPPPAPEAPDFLRNDFWRAKTCQTALAGWAQMRHTFTLPAKESEFYLGLALVPPGFVEPNAEFFSRMAQLEESVMAYLEANDIYAPSGAGMAEEMRSKIPILEQILAGAAASGVTVEEYMEKKHFSGMTEVSLLVGDASDSTTIWLGVTDATKLKDAIAALKAGADAYDLGEKKPKSEPSEFRGRWETLRTMTYTLAAMSNKQILKQPWSDDEAKFLKTYGEKLGYVMGYFGNSYEVPRDDAPRWVEVARDTRPGRDSALAVAVGRPRYLYVLYPWNGMEILCQGSVMQYYEYDAKGTPLTDAEWLKLLDSSDAPRIPEWLRPFADAPAKPAAR